MSLIKKSAAGLVLTAAAAATSAAFAAGFQLTEQSSLGLGRAYAGAGIVGDDLSAVHYNPAGMTLLPGVQMQAGGVWIAVDAPFKGKDGSEENGRLKGQMIPAGYITRQVNDQLWLGFAMTVPFGMGTQYDEDWAFNQRGTDSKIYTFDMNPSFAYKMNDFISFGGGISVQYAKAELGMRMKKDLSALGLGVKELAQADVEGDSWDWGYNLGVMISPTDKLRFGLSYRSSIEHDASGTTDVSLNPMIGSISPDLGGIAQAGVLTMNSDVTIETPDTVMLTGTWEATEKLRLSGLVRWANWSNFKSLKLKNSGALVNLIPEHVLDAKEIEVKNNWEDTWLFSVGADYKLNNSWTVRGGIAYEMDPIDDQSTRMAVIPDTDRLWLTLGSTYKYNDDLQFDVGAAYLKGVGDKDLYSKLKSEGGVKVGEYDKLDCYMVGVQMQYRF